MLIVDHLQKRYKRTQAVKDLSFQVEDGAIYGFVGPNGAGKTTTMKIIATLMNPTSGGVWVDGYEVESHLADVRRRVGYMPDYFGVYDDLRVNEYLDFYGACYGIGTAKRQRTALDLLELVGLSHKANEYVDALSRGMQQRLCLARTLMHDPSLLVLDEPASGLDPRTRVEMRELLQELRNMGKTILISSHILPELAEMCTHIGIIEAGEMVTSGTVAEVMRALSQHLVIRVRLEERISQAADLLSEIPGVRDVGISGSAVEFVFEGSDTELGAILFRLISEEYPVITFSEVTTNLEEIFMQITKGVVA